MKLWTSREFKGEVARSCNNVFLLSNHLHQSAKGCFVTLVQVKWRNPWPAIAKGGFAFSGGVTNALMLSWFHMIRPTDRSLQVSRTSNGEGPPDRLYNEHKTAGTDPTNKHPTWILLDIITVYLADSCTVISNQPWLPWQQPWWLLQNSSRCAFLKNKTKQNN